MKLDNLALSDKMLLMIDYSPLRIDVHTTGGDNYFGMKVAKSGFLTPEEKFIYFYNEEDVRILIPSKNIIKIEIYKPE